ncbi:MAG: helix-turn-helix transcriptional regulator [Silanimonas sp.]
MRASRLLSLLILLQLRGRQNAAALAREFEVSVRTVYRDVEQLSAAGVPIYAERGRGGGFALLGGYTTRLTGLTPSEADAVGLLGAAQAAAELGFGDEAQSARRKLLASLPADTGAGAQRVAERFHLDPLPWYGRRRAPVWLRPLAEAVWTDRRVALTYRSWKGEVVREVSPLGLVLKAGDWYLVAVVKRGLRTYRVAAIQSMTMLESTVTRPAGFTLTQHWAEAVAAFEDGLRTQTARVRLSPTGWRLLHEQQPQIADIAEAQAGKPDADGWREVDLPTETGSHAVRELLRLGSEVQVLAPSELRAALAAEAARIVALHAAERR